jgi:hypothetical protein
MASINLKAAATQAQLNENEKKQIDSLSNLFDSSDLNLRDNKIVAKISW